MSSIILVGFMGVGKTTVGELVSKKLNREFYDTDCEIVKQEGMSIESIFEKYGEEHFRRLEKDMLEKLCSYKDIVLATGGGIVKDKENLQVMRNGGRVFYLQANPEKIYENIKDDTSRPLLQAENKIEAIRTLLEERQSLYMEASHYTICVSNISADLAAEQIAGLF